MHRDAVTAVVLMALAAVYYMMADALPRSQLSDNVGADGFPKLLAGALFLLAVVLLLMGLFQRRAGDPAAEREKRAREKQAALRAAGMLGLGVGYLLLVTLIGYPFAVAFLVAGVLLYYGEALSRKVVVTACIGGLLFWVFFVIAMDIPMPMGIWAKLFGGGM